MTWITQSNNPIGAPYTDWNEEFKVLLDQAELPEDVARKTLGKFLMHNPGMMVEILTRKMLEPYQRIVVKGWLQKNFSLTIAGRSFGKSMLGSHFCYLYCLLNPGHHILICAATFRSSRQIVERVDEWAQGKDGILLRETMRATPTGGTIIKKQELIWQ